MGDDQKTSDREARLMLQAADEEPASAAPNCPEHFAEKVIAAFRRSGFDCSCVIPSEDETRH